MRDAIAARDGDSPLSGFVLWIVRILAVGAAGISGYLLFVSLQNRGLPPGCGAGSGCEDVLTSRWSQLWGVPVSAPALAVDLALLSATFFVGSPRSGSVRRFGWVILTVSSTAIVAAAVWFIGLQLVAIHAFCRWCMAAHLLGVAAAALVFWKTPRLEANHAAASEADEESALRGTRPFSVTSLRLCGLMTVIAFALLQSFADSYRPASVQRLQAGVNDDTGPGPDRVMSVLNGQLQLEPHKLPMLGSPDAPHQLVLMFDYCCPHCRATHGYLIEGLHKYDHQYGVVVLPMPLNSACNRYWEHTEERFKDSCELARLALAVWRINRIKFIEFDKFLFESESPPKLEDAQFVASLLVDHDKLGPARHDSWIDRYIEQNTKAYHNSKAERLPVIMSPDFATIVGRPESAEQLFEILEKELQLQPPSH